MIAGATYREGVAVLDGVMVVHGLVTGQANPANTTYINGANTLPMIAKAVSDGAVLVRFA